MFATQDISIGTIIGTYRGPVVARAKTQEDLEERVKDMSNDKLWTKEPLCKGDDYEAIDGNFTDMAKIQDYRPNEADRNSEIYKDARVKAIKNICEGDEIFIDYGEWYWNNFSANFAISQATDKNFLSESSEDESSENQSSQSCSDDDYNDEMSE